MGFGKRLEVILVKLALSLGGKPRHFSIFKKMPPFYVQVAMDSSTVSSARAGDLQSHF